MNKLVSIKEDENINIVNKIYANNAPEKIYIPVNDTLKINDYIFKNIYFDKYISSVSGIISDIKTFKIKEKNTECFEIINDFKENIKGKEKKIKIENKKELLNILIRNKLDKIVNKINIRENIENIVISSIDDEFYSVKEFIRLSNNYSEILETLDFLIKVFNVDYSIIAVKNTNFNSIKNVKSIIGTYPNIKISLVPDKYLISHSKFLCEFLNIKEENTLILTTNELYDIYNILNSKPIIEQLITISGNAIAKSLVINAKLGVSLKELIREYIKIKDQDYDIYVNGVLSGYQASSIDEIIITKDINCIVLNKKDDRKVEDCINCGACYKICPYKINVKRCYFKKLSHKKCIGCGLCNFICPANINLKEIVKSDYNEENISK